MWVRSGLVFVVGSVFACLTEKLPTGFPWLSHIFGFVGLVR